MWSGAQYSSVIQMSVDGPIRRNLINFLCLPIDSAATNKFLHVERKLGEVDAGAERGAEVDCEVNMHQRRHSGLTATQRTCGSANVPPLRAACVGRLARDAAVLLHLVGHGGRVGSEWGPSLASDRECTGSGGEHEEGVTSADRNPRTKSRIVKPDHRSGISFKSIIKLTFSSLENDTTC